MASLVTQNSRELAAEHPEICPQRFQQALVDKIQRCSADEARLRIRRFCCACAIIAILLLAVLLVYVAFAILADDEPLLEDTIVIARSQGKRLATVSGSGEGYASAEEEGTESAEVELVKGLEYFCGTPECSRYAAFIQGQLDASHNPCRNLYDHVCARWQSENQDYASKETPSGTYSVMDAVAREYREKLARLLLRDDCPQPNVCRFFAACSRGNLTTSAELESLTRPLRLRDFTVDAVVTTIVQMARLGVSPFFDVSVTKITSSSSSAEVRIKLSQPREKSPVQGLTSAPVVGNTTTNVPRMSSPLWLYGTRWTKLPGPGTNLEVPEGEFRATIEQKLCLEVALAYGDNLKNCTLSSDSEISPAWDYGWYKTVGMSLLARETQRQLSAAWLSVGGSSVGGGSESRKHAKLSSACLTLIGRYDPYSPSYLVGTEELATSSVRRARYQLLALKNMIDQKLGTPSGVSLSIGYRTYLQNDPLVLSEYQTDIYGNASETPSLPRFLRNATWKRWTVENDAPRDAFAPSPFRSKVTEGVANVTVVVPLTLLNATALQDPWLTYLSLARTAPRVVKTIFSGSRELSERLSQTRLAKCPVKAERRHLSFSPVVDADIDKEKQDLTELSSFYAAFHFYRHYVGHGSAVPGTELNGDLLFLLYYVYNMCEALAVGLETKNAAAVRKRRRRVQALAESFVAVLFPACEAPVELADCDLESGDLLLSRNEVSSPVSIH
ncbi:hypothetical protein HPB51_007267 [Rhipicephalus microplus]|uniref:Uncharacterized protein n=1 Tax=Rhipicephalus microplus TaxID=6941 RepID=A0A9J6E0E8_RHIMP|nr:hypothetical protein HPB51_007267 [Rhipicephalus microplus]